MGVTGGNGARVVGSLIGLHYGRWTVWSKKQWGRSECNDSGTAGQMK